MTALRVVPREAVSLGDACDAYLAALCGPEQKSTRDAYGKAYRALTAAFSGAVDGLDADDVAAWFTRRYGKLAPATWNLRLCALQAAVAYWRRQGWLDSDPLVRLERRKPREDSNRALPRAEVERLLSLRSAPLRDRLLWSMLYETAARAEEILSLDVSELDQAGLRARVTGKGNKVRAVIWQTRTARMIAAYLRECTACNGQGIAGWPVVTECAACATTGAAPSPREAGPLFLTSLKACVPLAACDVDPGSGKARLSYRRAEEIFSTASGGSTLHQLRHSSLTHDADAGTSTPMLLARSGHASVRSLARYAKVSEEALAAHQRRNDPKRRKAW